MLARYMDLPIEQVFLDYDNPRIARMLEIYTKETLNADALAMALGSSESSYESLKESIRANGGIIHPIIVNKNNLGEYLVVEGNTRVQIYRKFIQDNIPGDWTSIRALVYEGLDTEAIHSIRLQAHLVGPREWDPYSKAKYLNYLKNEAMLPMNLIISYCGGNTKASEVQNMIESYNDMEKYYRPLCSDDSAFDHKKFSAFVELQSKSILDNIVLNKFSKTDFSRWIIDGNIDRLADVRRLPDILRSTEARKVFLRENSSEAIKVLAIEEITSDRLKDVPYEMLATELSRRMRNITLNEILHLRTDSEYADKFNTLQNVLDEIQFVVDQIQGG